ncbi:unnamed protein product [Trichogramma brassicae]|uniref:Uncharacterized protein n=1 Tax=Trichogramma brassicae TaxID=86971 RepID=A0A6H5ICJ9_9HYME|nr:unnamed protein product [Trichogramma brassicae]
MKEHRKHQRDRQLRIPASTHEPVGPLIDKTAPPDAGSDAQAEFRSGTDAVVAPPTARPLALPFPTPSKPTATVRLSYLNRWLDHPSGGYPFPSPSRRRFSDEYILSAVLRCIIIHS